MHILSLRFDFLMTKSVVHIVKLASIGFVVILFGRESIIVQAALPIQLTFTNPEANFFNEET